MFFWQKGIYIFLLSICFIRSCSDPEWFFRIRIPQDPQDRLNPDDTENIPDWIAGAGGATRVGTRRISPSSPRRRGTREGTLSRRQDYTTLLNSTCFLLPISKPEKTLMFYRFINQSIFWIFVLFLIALFYCILLCRAGMNDIVFLFSLTQFTLTLPSFYASYHNFTIIFENRRDGIILFTDLRNGWENEHVVNEWTNIWIRVKRNKTN